MDLSLLTTNTVVAFLLVLFRIAGMLVSAPLFNMRSIPMQAKVGLAFATALLLFPFHAAQLVIPADLIQFTLLALQETVIGLLIGFAANLIFVALQMAGEFISFQMGLSVANVLDPVSQTQVPVLGQFFFYFAALIFLTLNVHHALLLGVDKSFQVLPLGHFFGESATVSGALIAGRFIELTSGMFATALLIGVPVMGVMLVTEIALSFVAKVMPQMNIFMVGIPLKVAVGLLVMLLFLPFLGEVLKDQFADLFRVLTGLYRS